MNNFENINSDNVNNNYDYFESAYDLCTAELSHDMLLNYLQCGNIYQKQYAALNFDKVSNSDDVKALINNLTGCDGKIREAVAFKINQILVDSDDYVKSVFSDNTAEIFADASVDINANICRLVIDSVILLKQFTDFSSRYTQKITFYALDAIDKLNKFEFRDKKYVINKQLFKLYWCLEALLYFYEFADDKNLDYIISESCKNTEYTVREKAARIVLNSGKYNNLKHALENDENYYVRSIILNH